MDEPGSDIGETVGQRLKAAREASNITLDAVAAQTRIPVRHLLGLENSEWDTLPAPAYCVGFAKNYAAVVGLDRAEIAADLRDEMGGMRQVYPEAEVFEPADPNRSMPKWLILGALVALVVLLFGLNWMRNRSLEPTVAPTEVTTTTATTTPTQAAPAPAVAATGPVVITATQEAWIKVRERGGATLHEAMLRAGETFEVPATATAPLLDTGRPEALRITAGGRDVPAIGPAGRSVASVSLLPADLARGPTAAPSTATTPAPAR